jgi:hypothetical protein
MSGSDPTGELGEASICIGISGLSFDILLFGLDAILFDSVRVACLVALT